MAKRRSHMRKSYVAKQSHSVQHEMRTVECETRILNHEHICSLSLLGTRHNDSGHCTHERDTVETCVFESFLCCVVHEPFSRQILFCAVSMSLTLFSAMNEASFEGALLDSQHFPTDADLEGYGSAEQHEFHPRGPVDAPSNDFLPHWKRQQVRFVEVENTPTDVCACCGVGRTRREDGGCV